MDKKDKTITKLLLSLYYMMGLVEATSCKAAYGFVLETMSDAERDLMGEAL